MIETVCAKFRKQNHPNNTLLLTWAAFLSHFRPILHDLNVIFYIIYIYMIMCVGVPLRARTVLEMVHLDGRAGWRARELRALSEVLLRASFVCKGIP